jgi:hypothetical protein
MGLRSGLLTAPAASKRACSYAAQAGIFYNEGQKLILSTNLLGETL